MFVCLHSTTDGDGILFARQMGEHTLQHLMEK